MTAPTTAMGAGLGQHTPGPALAGHAPAGYAPRATLLRATLLRRSAPPAPPR